MLVNALRAHMAEFGIIAPQGLRHVEILTKTISHEQERIRELAPGSTGSARSAVCWRPCRVLASWARAIADPSLFRSGREFAAWLGMTQRQNSSGGKERLGQTSKRGDKYIRSLLTAVAVAVVHHAHHRPTRDGEWVRALLAFEGSFRAVGIAAACGGEEEVIASGRAADREDPKNQSAKQRAVLIGTRSVNFIRASGQMHRTKGPDV